MTENGNWIEEYAAHDLWRVEKSITPLPDEEQLAAWGQAVAVLRDLGKLAETLRNDPLLLALTDAMDRAREEHARLEDRLQRPEGEQLHPREEERLRGLIWRADALNNAYTNVLDTEWTHSEMKADMLRILGELRREASEQYKHYKQEVGIPT